MITSTPDKSLGLERLQREIQAYKGEIESTSGWHFREWHVDRGVLDPFYIIQFDNKLDDFKDDLYDQELFTTPVTWMKGVCMTQEKKKAGGNYWHAISNKNLKDRLTNFLDNYTKDKFQPPGWKADKFEARCRHDIFDKKRFLFEIRSPRKSIIGVGPKMYAGVLDTGAVCGQVSGENGEPLDGVVVQLVAQTGIQERTRTDGGLFWFSKVPQGKYTVKVKDRACVVHILRHDVFGNIKGWITDQDGYPIENVELNFRAPDGEIFNAFSDDSGNYTTGPVPAYPVTDSPLSKYPYIMQIPGFLFSVTKTVYVKDAVIGGVLRGNDGAVLTNEKVILKQGGTTVGESTTDSYGRFRFFNLLGGRYEIELPGQKIFLSQSTPGRVEGKESAGVVNETRIELVADGEVIATERLNTNKEYSFDDVTPGNYEVRVK